MKLGSRGFSTTLQNGLFKTFWQFACIKGILSKICSFNSNTYLDQDILKDKKKGRPVTKPGELKDGYYLELRNKGSNSAVKIRRETKTELDATIAQYERTKLVSYLGEVKNARWVDGKNKGKKTA